MKLKRWLKYLIYMIMIYILIVLREYIEKLFTASYLRYENPAIYCYAVISLLLGVCIGLILGLEHIIRESGKEGKWIFNLPKLILIGIPSLYFSLTNLWIISGNQFVYGIIAYPLFYLFRNGSGYVSIFQIILGYMIITSFIKYNENI